MKFIIVALLGAFVYMVLSKKDESVANENALSSPEANPELLTQPQQLFPFHINTDRRVDNADQPWYVDSRAFMGEEDGEFLDRLTEQSPNANIMSYDTQSVWAELNLKYIQ